MEFIERHASKLVDSMAETTTVIIKLITKSAVTNMANIVKQPRNKIFMSQFFLGAMLLWTNHRSKAIPPSHWPTNTSNHGEIEGKTGEKTIASNPEIEDETGEKTIASNHGGIRGVNFKNTVPSPLLEKFQRITKVLNRRLQRTVAMFVFRIQESTRSGIHRIILYSCLVFAAHVGINVLFNYEINQIKPTGKYEASYGECLEMVSKAMKAKVVGV